MSKPFVPVNLSTCVAFRVAHSFPVFINTPLPVGAVYGVFRESPWDPPVYYYVTDFKPVTLKPSADSNRRFCAYHIHVWDERADRFRSVTTSDPRFRALGTFLYHEFRNRGITQDRAVRYYTPTVREMGIFTERGGVMDTHPVPIESAHNVAGPVYESRGKCEPEGPERCMTVSGWLDLSTQEVKREKRYVGFARA